jgi:hypothetical protein
MAQLICAVGWKSTITINGAQYVTISSLMMTSVQVLLAGKWGS